MRSKTDWPPEVAGVLYLLELQPPEAAMLVGCFLAAGFAHAGMVCPSAPISVNGRTHPLGPGKGWTEGDAGLRDGPAPPENLSHTTQLPLLR